ncbi:MAG: copper resistance protein NlpE N-terminal domain-containing protein [Coriobacteriales bacterium]|nr:copper resistance protein NlpE N-terminal domain-containing protein [Coriobacteriales bacterium]
MLRKFSTIIFVLVFALGLCVVGCGEDTSNDFTKGKHDTKYVGTWKATNVQYNAILLPSTNIFENFSVTLEKDGSAKFVMEYKDKQDANENYEGKWRNTKTGFELDDSDNMQFEYNDQGYVSLDIQDIKIIFAKDGESNYELKDISELEN